MKNLCIGIIELTIGWKIILDQIGVWYEEVDFDGDLALKYSTIIVNQSVTINQEEQLHKYNDNGSSILETSSGDLFSHARFTAKKKVKRLINTGAIPFLAHIPFLDIFSEAELYNGQDNFDGLIDFEKHDQGIVCNLGIEPGNLIMSNSYTRKRFFYKKDMHPDELVSNVSKGSLIELIICILKELHFQQGLPFVCKWTSPKEQPVFTFRVDSDYGDQESVTELQNIGKQHQIPFTWFLHIEAHENWLGLFKEFQNSEIALHGYEHGTSISYEHVFNNIERGLQLLKDSGFYPKGFCAPYGIWNDTLAEVLQKFEFEYTSEFTIGYDSNPFPSYHLNNELKSLQIPIHPICTGSLNRKGATTDEMKVYFLNVMENKLARYEPVMFYHHPLQSGTTLWNDVFRKVNELKLTKLSFSEYAEFWKNRLNFSFEVFINPKTKELVFSGSLKDLLIQVSKNQTSFELIKVSEHQEIQSCGEFNYHTTNQPAKEEIEQLSSSKLQLLKTSILDWKNRNRL
ncbi:MAG: polysaccharide deacetylase family protein [Balneolaceae bacterium]